MPTSIISGLTVSGASTSFSCDILNDDTLHVQRELNGRDTLECTLASATGTDYGLVPGNVVTLQALDGRILFVGQLASFEFKANSSAARFWSIKCVSFDSLADRFTVPPTLFQGDDAAQTFTGDGTTTAFTLTLAVGSGVAIKKDGGDQTVGVLSVDTGKDWYYVPGSTTITQAAGAPVLTSANTLVVTYFLRIASDAILRSIVSYFPSSENVTASNVPFGMPLLATYQITQRTKISAVFDEISTLTKWPWIMEYDPSSGPLAATVNVRFFDPTIATVFPTTLTSGTAYEALTVSADLSAYANRVIVPNAGNTTETFSGNGSATTFTLMDAVRAAPAVAFNGIPASVGVLSVDTGREWYYQIGSPVITQAAGAGPLGTSDTLAVSYALDVVAEDTTEQANQKFREGRGSGIYELIVQPISGGTIQDARDLANATLRKSKYMRYDVDGFTVTNARETWADQLEIGKILPVDIDELIAGMDVPSSDSRPYLISSTSLSLRGGRVNVWEVRLTRGEYQAGWQAFYEPDTSVVAPAVIAPQPDVAGGVSVF